MVPRTVWNVSSITESSIGQCHSRQRSGLGKQMKVSPELSVFTIHGEGRREGIRGHIGQALKLQEAEM